MLVNIIVTMLYLACPSFSQDGSLTRENIQWLEQVFRDNVGPGQTEFTLEQFKKIVPSKNVSFILFRNNLLHIAFSVVEILC